jgi:hypothetical protein
MGGFQSRPSDLLTLGALHDCLNLYSASIHFSFFILLTR